MRITFGSKHIRPGAIFRNEHFINALRATLTVVVPVVICLSFGYTNVGVAAGLGALLTALCDVPDDRHNKTRTLFLGSLLLALAATVTGLALSSQLLVCCVIALFCLAFSMLSVFGGSIGAIGSIALIMMVFTMGFKPANNWLFGLFILMGGSWYAAGSALYLYFFPLRPIRHAVSECVMEISRFLSLKARFYQLDVPEDNYQQVITGHMKISEKQEAIRTILLKEEVILHRKSPEHTKLVHLATEVIDLYEQVLAVHYDYHYIRKVLQEANVLYAVNQLINWLADDLHETSIAITTGKLARHQTINHQTELLAQLALAANDTDALKAEVIGKLCINLKTIRTKIDLIAALIEGRESTQSSIAGKDAIRFGSGNNLNWKTLKDQVSFKSPIFRFSLRLAITCLFGYLATLFVLPGKYNYWLLLTILIVARPAYSITRRRNFQRITGTLMGILVAFTLLSLIHDTALQITLIVVCLMGYLGFLYINYLVSVVFITTVAIIGLYNLGGNNLDLMMERCLYTLLGCSLALTAAFLFPVWERKKLRDYVNDVLNASITYLGHLNEVLSNQMIDAIDYKLARKQLFIAMANLSRSYQRMLSEPNFSDADREALYHLQIYSHELFASAASLFLNRDEETAANEQHHVQMVKEAIAYLQKSTEQASLTIPLTTNQQYAEQPVNKSDPSVIGRQTRQILKLAQRIYQQTTDRQWLQLAADR